MADSDPQAEWNETITKARALVAGITATRKKEKRIIGIKKTISRKVNRKQDAGKGFFK